MSSAQHRGNGATSKTDASKKRPKRSIPEELFDRTVAYLDGPVNARAERVMKSRLVLAPIGLSLTVGSRVALAMRERSVRSLWRTID